MKKLLLVAVLGCASVPALGQEPSRTDLFFGPSYLNTDEQSLYGGAVAVTRYLRGSLGVVLDTSLHFGSAEGVDLRELNLAAGPRFAFNRAGSASFFLQALFGLRRDSQSITVLDVTISDSQNRFGMAFGGGVDLRLSPRWAVRVQGDYLYAKSEGETVDGIRVSAGVVYRFGAGAPKQP
jgi:opacity protein-like surface antigen